MKKSTLFVGLGRLALFVAFLSLLGAWYIQLSGTTPFGISQQHAFNDSIALALIGIGLLFDGIIHTKEESK